MSLTVEDAKGVLDRHCRLISSPLVIRTSYPENLCFVEAEIQSNGYLVKGSGRSSNEQDARMIAFNQLLVAMDNYPWMVGLASDPAETLKKMLNHHGNALQVYEIHEEPEGRYKVLCKVQTLPVVEAIASSVESARQKASWIALKQWEQSFGPRADKVLEEEHSGNFVAYKILNT